MCKVNLLKQISKLFKREGLQGQENPMANRQDNSEMQANHVHRACLPDGEPNKGGEEHQESERYVN